ncbi:MAG: putative rane protein [Hydrocarboniphaga sp.]|uniref:VOC family protein n=1 Tax=Hydrocarboniphaga sp. TaxID=2033016 RepID=UPI00261CD276|nr:VOC family protein [Hydrocarboniphaga sp.]MDB5968414.1 putative rane protein [Hydrocarboniphaga sp.]
MREPPVILFGIGYGAGLICKSLVISRYFGTGPFALVMGTMAPLSMSLSALSPYLIGLSYDHLGSYTVGLAALAALALVAAFAQLLAGPPQRRPSAVITEKGGSMKFLHVGFAVKDIHRSIGLYAELFGIRWEPVKEYPITTWVEARENPSRSLVTHGYTDTGFEFEMVENVAGISADSLVLGEREGLSHLAFTVDDLAAERARLEASGLKMVSEFKSSKVDFQFFKDERLAGALVQFHGER